MGESTIRTDLANVWPVFGLRITAGALELRSVCDDDLPALVALAREGIHPPETMPFSRPWTDAPVEELGRTMAAYYWRTRAELSPAAWTVDLVARWQGDVVGVQGLITANYPVTRSCETGSWLGSRYQGRGLGTLMRQTVCEFAFDWLGAAEVTSSAWIDNAASLAVSSKVGYVPNGRRREERRPGEVGTMQDLVLTRPGLVRHGLSLDVAGAAEFKAFVGLVG